MKFRTEIFPSKSALNCTHQDKIMLLGSCFAENMQAYFQNHLFDVCSNPFGIIYNPESIFTCLDEIVQQKVYTEQDLYFYNELYFSLQHHTRFNHWDKMECLNRINLSIQEACTFLQQANCIIITLGTAFVYETSLNFQQEFNTSKKTAANCHKLPNTYFDKKLLSLEACEQALTRMANLFPNKKILFTVSPVRHWRDGAIENTRSKSILIESIHRVCEKQSHVFYFPAYEIMMDDLRDYRFYAEDLLHPNTQAVEYIWSKFSATFFSEETQEMNKRIYSIQAMRNHRPRFENSDAFKKHQEKIKIEMERLRRDFPKMEFNWSKQETQD